MMEPARTVQLPQVLCEAVERQFVGSTFPDLESLLIFILQELARDEAQRLDEQEARIIEERLRRLGYL